ncbi:polysaccharide pyruvyl transferase family protein [Sphingomonas japonica]|nr:polysaccharide pyruvyl transferase family protein [Sphingomonas japonica]
MLLHGSYFGYNFGDTLLCQLFAAWVKDGQPDTRLILPLANARNCRMIGADARGPANALTGDALIFAGGGYFGQPSSGLKRWTARAYLRHMLLANWARRRIPYCILGTGVGPVSSARMQSDLAKLFEEADIAVVRDPESAQFLHDWGVRREVEIGVDAVVTAQKEELRRNAHWDRSALPVVKGPLVALHTEVHASPEEVGMMAELISRLLTETDWHLLLLSDGVRTGNRTGWHEKVPVDPASAARVTRLGYDRDPQKLIGVLDAVDLVITTKLHVGIVRCALNKPVISIPRHAKTPRFYRQMALSDWCVSDPRNRVDLAMELAHGWENGLRPSFTAFEKARSTGFYRRRVASFCDAVASRG